MVTQVLRAVYKEIRGLHEAAYVLAVFTFASQILALIRDRLLAHQFGAGIELDLYYAAFRIPDLLFVVFASVLSVYVLIPFMSEAEDRGGKKEARQFMSQVFTLFLVAYGVLALLVGFFAHDILRAMFPGYGEEQHETLVLIVRILLLQPFFLSISNLYGVVTQLENKFLVYALSPLLYNIGIILGILFLYPLYGVAGLAYGVVIGALLHLLMQVPLILKSGVIPRITFRFDIETLLRILTTSLPRALTLSLHQVVLLAMVGLASHMHSGSVSIFQFALNLQSVPLAIIGVSYSVAAFPTLAKMFVSGDRNEYVSYVATALRHIFFWSIPIIALVIVVRAQIVRVILGSGAFDWDATKLTAAGLALFVFSLAAQAVNLLIVRAFYAGGDTRTPFVVTIFSSIVAFSGGLLLHTLFISNVSFALFITKLLRVSDVPGAEVLMLPLGYSLGMITHATVLLALFMRRFRLPFHAFGGVLMRGILASLCGGVVAYVALNILVFGIQNDTVLGIMLQGGIAGIIGMAVVILTLYVLKSVELREAYKAIHRRMLIRTVIPPQQSDDAAA
jgi:putative peptidoglycan lipid II flippase